MSPNTFHLLFALLALFHQAHASVKFWGGKAQDTEVSTTLHPSAAPDNQDTLIEATIPKLSIPESMQQAVSIIKNAEALPLCRKVATAALVHSCATIEGVAPHDGSTVPPGSNMMLRQETTVYSARLAVCELQEADIVLPTECEAFVPTERTTKKRFMAGHVQDGKFSQPTELYLDYDEITERDTKKCVNALHSKPQWWTSYSNSNQNAAFICHTMRRELKKDETIRHYENLFESTVELDNFLRTMPHVYDAMQQEMQDNMRQFVSDLYADNAEMQAKLERLLVDTMTTFKVEVSKAVQDIQESMAEGAERWQYMIAAAHDMVSQDIGRIKQDLVSQQELIGANTQDLVKYDIVFADLEHRAHAMLNGLAQSGDAIVATYRALGEQAIEIQIASNQTMENMQQANEDSRETKDNMEQAREAAREVTNFFATVISFLQSITSKKMRLVFCIVAIVFVLLRLGDVAREWGGAFVGKCLAALGKVIGLGYALYSCGLFAREVFDESDQVMEVIFAFVTDHSKVVGFVGGPLLAIILWFFYKRHVTQRRLEKERLEWEEYERRRWEQFEWDRVETARAQIPYDPATAHMPRYSLPASNPQHDARRVSEQWVKNGAIFGY